jgi:hypothetical protein
MTLSSPLMQLRFTKYTKFSRDAYIEQSSMVEKLYLLKFVSNQIVLELPSFQ